MKFSKAFVSKEIDHLASKFKNDHDKDSPYFNDRIKGAVFALELLALKLGFVDISDDLEVWRENNYNLEMAEKRGT